MIAQAKEDLPSGEENYERFNWGKEAILQGIIQLGKNK